jgi:hypothetical protein
MRTDPVTGRMQAVLAGLPQAPIGRIEISLGGGQADLFASPLACGPAPTVVDFVPYGGGAAVESSASVLVGPGLPGLRCPGPLPFEPQLLLERSSDRAAASTLLTAILRRGDGQSLPRRFALTLPSGLSAALGSVQLCSPAEVAAIACPGESRVGDVLVTPGPGMSATQLSGGIYLTGSYRHAPYGFLVDVPARLGSFDLGEVAFRAALEVGDRSGRVMMISDPMPETVEGVQLRLRAIELHLNRPGFLRNPTGCRSNGATGTVESTSGSSVPVSVPLVTVGCRKLRFRPRFRLSLEGGGTDRRVGIRMRVRMGRREAAVRAMRIALPRAIQLDTGGLGAICSRPDARLGECPEASRIGTSRAWTPVLGKPLSGAAYIVQPEDNGEPDVWLTLSQGGLHFGLRGHTEVVDGRFVTKLSGFPDMPMTKLVMRLGEAGGGPLSLNGGVCGGDERNGLAATVFLIGQNGVRRRARVPIAARARCQPLELEAR